MIAILFLLSVEWQTVSSPISDSLQEFGIYMTIAPTELKYVHQDTSFFGRYEIQLQIYDRKGNLINGDYWERKVLMDTVNILDTVMLLSPKTAAKFAFKIIDLHADEILNITGKILSARFLSNIRWFYVSDTLEIYYTLMNEQSDAESMRVVVDEKNVLHKQLRPETYNDSLICFVGDMPNGEYPLKFLIFSKQEKLDELMVPIRIARPFYLDDKTWFLKINQLEYIATPSELDRLRKAEKANRDSVWTNFWKQYDPTPNTEFNEKEHEYFERINYAEEHFSFGDKGWRSDRAKVYVRYGSPDEIQSKPYELSTKPYEIWLYYKLNLKFVFYDRNGFGDYILLVQNGERI